MKVIRSDQTIYKFSHNMEYVERVKPGEAFMVETNDCFFQQIKNEDCLVLDIDFSKVNPATGPIYVEGARAGDLLKVHILSIEVDKAGVGITMKGGGVLGKDAQSSKTRVISIVGDYALLGDVRIPIDPMIGVIGVAPKAEDGEWITATPWKHGGNMDTRDVRAGSILYLPVAQEGALLALGDCHAAMGDGEISMAGLEIPAKILLKVDLIKEKTIDWPIIETKEEIMIVASGDDVEAAIYEASKQAVNYLQTSLDIDWADAYILASIAVNIRISQLVNEKKTVRAIIPKSILNMDKLWQKIQ